jgi:hypothetical protein
MAMTMSISRVMVTLKTEQYILTLPPGSLKVSRPDGIVGVSRPDQLAVITEDIRTFLTRAMELRFSPLTGEGSYEEVALFNVRGRWDGDVQAWRGQVCSRLELPICRC